YCKSLIFDPHFGEMLYPKLVGDVTKVAKNKVTRIHLFFETKIMIQRRHTDVGSMTTYSSFGMSGSSSAVRRIKDYAPSSIVSTVSSSWETCEDYDAKATNKIKNMMTEIDAYLYHGCLITSTSISHSEDLSVEYIPTPQRCHSPYFYIPAHSYAEDCIIFGKQLHSDMIGSKNSTENNVELSGDGVDCLGLGVGEWSDVDILRRDVYEKKSRWYLFETTTTTTTTTQQKNQHNKIKISGLNGISGLKQHFTASSYPPSDLPKRFAIVVLPDGIPNLKTVKPGLFILLVTWEYNDKVDEFCVFAWDENDDGGVDVDVVGRVNVYSVMALFKGVDCAFGSLTLPTATPIPTDNWVSELTIHDDNLPVVVDRFNNQVFAVDGVVDESFAYDSTDDESDDENVKKSERRSRVHPVTPQMSIKHDILAHVFDDLWSEVKPTINSCFLCKVGVKFIV
ncbi:hypothetical protein HK098_007944, partial [Nowakowskiella sp. JEL0407]